MKINKNTSRLLGIAFILQFATSLISGLIPSKVLPGTSLPASGQISLNFANIAEHAWLIRTSILGQVITAMGIVFLGAMLYIALKQYSKKIALIGFGMYVFESALLAGSMIWAFLLVVASKEYVASQGQAYLETLGTLSFQAMGFGMTLALIPFTFGALLFYYLLYTSNAIPRWLSVWGIIGTGIVLIATILTLFGYVVPVIVYVPYVPFELAVGIWILVKGLQPGKISAQ